MGETTLDRLIQDQEHNIRALARYALRYRTDWYLSDEDDLFQEACCWLVSSMWEWDEDRGVDLAYYVIYNIGARLGTQVKAERAMRRHPDANKTRRVDIWEEAYEDGSVGSPNEAFLANNDAPIDHTIAIREALQYANDHLTDLAKDLLVALANNNGNLTWATRELLERDHIRSRFGSDENHLRYVLRRKVMPEIFQFLQPMNIIPET